MRRIEFNHLRVPALVGEIELSQEDSVEWYTSPTLQHASALLLVRNSGVPLGFVAFEADDWRAGASEILEDVRREFESLSKREAAHGAGGNSSRATVIVCTRDHTDDLRMAILSLLDMNSEFFDVLVVDNAPSTDATRLLAEDIGRSDPRVRYTRENRPGLSAARNRGITEATGSIVAFTDDDCLVDRDWIASILRRFDSDSSIECVTGLVMARELETWPQLWFEQFAGFPKSLRPTLYDLGRHRPDSPFFPLSAGIFGSGNNMAFRVDSLRRLGGFDTALGHGTKAGGEDLDMFFRLVMSGGTLAYEPASIIRHRHRREYDALLRQLGDGGFVPYLTKFLINHPAKVAGFLTMVPSGLRSYAFGPRGKYVSNSTSIPRGMRLAELRGLVSGPGRYLLSRIESRRLDREFSSGLGS